MSVPVLIDVCGEKGTTIEGHLEKVKGFLDMWEEKTYQCHKGCVEELYAHCCGENGNGNGNGKALPTARLWQRWRWMP